MALQIRINPDRMREIANSQRVISDRADELSAKLKEIMVKLDNAWDGVASEEALNAIEQLISAGRNLSGDINESAQRLDSVANAFESVDEGNPVPVQIVAFRFLPSMIPGIIPINFPKLKGRSVRIIPDEVRMLAVRCRETSDELMGLMEDFFSTVNTLSESWEGRSYLKYVDDTAELKKGAKVLNETLRDFAERLTATATRFEEIDQMF